MRERGSLVVFGFANHHQDGEKLMPRKHVPKQTQFLERAKFATRDPMPFQKWPVGRESMPCIGGIFGRRGPDTLIYDPFCLGVCGQEKLLTADPARPLQAA